jgi:hypothetical protein
LGDLYDRCDAVSGHIPVYLNANETPTLLGYADESLGSYADAFSFHLGADDCKKLSTGNFSFSVNYKVLKPDETGPRGRVKLISIMLTGNRPLEKPGAKPAVSGAQK